MATFAQAFKVNVQGLNIPVKSIVNGAIVPIKKNADDALSIGLRNSDDVARSLAKNDEALSLIFKNADEITSNKILVGAAQDSIKKTDAVLETLGSKVARNAGDLLDVAGRLFDVIGLIAQLGTAARMEFIRRELLGEIAINRADIEVLENQILGFAEGIARNSDEISKLRNYVDSELMGLAETLQQIVNQNNALLTNTSALLGGQQLILNEIRNLPLLDKIQAVDAVCIALNSPCFPQLEFPITDLSGLDSKLDNIIENIGSFPYSCGDQSASYASVAQALQAVTCGGEINIDVDNSEVIGNLDGLKQDILDAIEDIETNAIVPDAWQVKVGNDRPQLAIQWANSLGNGEIGTSRYNLSIPHWNGSTNWSLLPKYRKGNWQGRIILKDNSRLMVYAYSASEAKRAIKALLKFVSPSMIKSRTPYIGEANVDHSTSFVEPTLAKFFEKGQLTEIPELYKIRQ